MVLNGKSLRKYPVKAGVPQGSTFGPMLCLLHINDLPGNFACSNAIYADDNTLYSSA